VIRDLEAYERFEKIILVHGCRHVAELAYGDLISEKLPADEHFGELVNEKLIYYPTVTREPYKNNGRISLLIENGKLCDDIGLPQLNKETDRVMLCGSPAMLADLRAILEARGFEEGNMGEPGHFVIEKAFAEK
jgi:ferredoxin--NADP+ reductase